MDVNQRQCVSHFTLKLQTQSQVPLWSLANEDVIYYEAIGQEPKWGPKSQTVKNLMSVFYRFFISDLLIFLLGSYRAISLWLCIKKKNWKQSSSFEGKKIFVGFGASSEKTIYSQYCGQFGNLLRVTSATAENCYHLGCPSLFYILSLLLKNSFGYTRKLNKISSIVGKNKVDWLTVCALNIGLYTFYRSYWQLAKRQGVDEVIFLAPEISAFAAVDENVNATFHQHGLIKISILFPCFNKIYYLTEDEGEYLKDCFKFKNVTISYLDSGIKSALFKKKNLLILSPNVFIQDRLRAMEPLVNWSKLNDWKIIIRPTPQVTQQEINTIKSKFPKAEFDDLTLSLEESINHWQPKMIASWLSTGLASALSRGFLPVSLCREDINDIWWNMIYPLKKRVLFWSRDKMQIEAALDSEEGYTQQIIQLKNQIDELSYSVK